MKNTFGLIVGASLLGALPGFAAGPSICDAVAGNLVANCGFETGNFNSWTVVHASSGSLIVITTIANSGTYAADFGATGTSDDSISQNLTTVAGDTYHLSFYLDNEFRGSGEDFHAYWDGADIFDASTSEFGYTKFSFTETGTGSDTLTFAGRNIPGDYFLDDVVVTGPTAAVPEPGSILLLGTLVLCIGGTLRRVRTSRQ